MMTSLSLLLASDQSNAVVTLMGIGTVFVGLIFLVVICTIMSSIIRKLEKPEKAAPAASTAPAAVKAPAPIANRPAFIAAVSAAIAEDLGTDVTAIRIVSVKQL